MATFAELMSRAQRIARAGTRADGMIEGVTARPVDFRQAADDLRRLQLDSYEPLEFTTKHGSRYFVLPDQTTVRNKAARSWHPGEEGWQDPSDLTVYTPPGRSDELMAGLGATISSAPDSRPMLLFGSGGNAAAVWHDGPKSGQFASPSVPLARRPTVGAEPIELFGNSLWRPREGDLGAAGHGTFTNRSRHFGTRITDIRPAPDWHKSVPLSPESLDYQRSLLDALRSQPARP